MESHVETTQRLIARPPFRIIRANTRAYLALNAITYGLFVVGFLVGLLVPLLNQAQLTRLNDDGTTDLVRSLINYPWLLAPTLLAVNTLRMGAATIVLPSMIVPIAGIPLFAYWALQTGMTLVPAGDLGWVALIPHSLTLVIELQAYILLLLGATCSDGPGSGPHLPVPRAGEGATSEVVGNSAGFLCLQLSCS
jgi:hypothetical protein